MPAHGVAQTIPVPSQTPRMLHVQVVPQQTASHVAAAHPIARNVITVFRGSAV